MKYILCSSFNNYIKNDLGEKISIKMTNDFINVISNNIKNNNKVVFVSNNPNTYDINDYYGKLLFESLLLSGLEFKNKIILDNRNSNNVEEIIKDADLIMISGGLVECQNKFLREININKYFNENTLIVGASAGAINLCEYSINFPIEQELINKVNKNNCFIKGLNIYKKIFVPHFNYINKEYIRGKNINAYNELLSISKNKELIAIDNDSFILIDNTKEYYYGNVYLINNSIVTNLE